MPMVVGEALRRTPESTRDAVIEGIPAGTLKADDNGARWAARFCIKHNTPFVRPMKLETHLDVMRETEMWGCQEWEA